MGSQWTWRQINRNYPIWTVKRRNIGSQADTQPTDSRVFLKDFIYLCLERRGEGEREGEKHQCVVASCTPPTGNLAHNPGMCPDWESNQWPFGSQAGTQSTEPHQLGWEKKYWKTITVPGIPKPSHSCQELKKERKMSAVGGGRKEEVREEETATTIIMGRNVPNLEEDRNL